ncbi:MAG: GNAT family N-acetyltransferase [Pseudomonadota bacterium]
MKVRDTKPGDVPALQEVVSAVDLFPSTMLPDMIDGFLSNAQSADLWLTCETAQGAPVGFCYAVPEELADGTWNMLAIGVLPSMQGQGAGGLLVAELEGRLRRLGHRVLIAETSGTDGFERARTFYNKNGYVEEARIREFWAKGDDKIVFWKALG